jgi:hypothetical protein
LRGAATAGSLLAASRWPKNHEQEAPPKRIGANQWRSFRGHELEFAAYATQKSSGRKPYFCFICARYQSPISLAVIKQTPSWPMT